MKNPIKILHIDPDYKVTYFIIREGSFIQSLVPLEAAITLLKKGTFDLIISEPHNRAIINKRGQKTMLRSLIFFCILPARTMVIHWFVRSNFLILLR